MQRFYSFAMTAAAVGERDFIERLKEFDESAWNQLYDEYFSRLYRYLYLRVGSQGDAEDLAAQVFEEACKRIRSYHYRGSSISSWLYRIAHNRAVDWTRRRRPMPMTTEISQPDQAERVAARDELARALNGLSPEQQQVLMLRHVEGHSAASAGQIMGKKAGAVRSLEFRALAALRRTLRPRSPEEKPQ
jgi:RNA polymerase sigma-70 factor (ECF subfamily)